MGDEDRGSFGVRPPIDWTAGRLSPMITSGQGAPTADAPEWTMYFDTAATSSEALLYVRERVEGGGMVWRAIEVKPAEQERR